MIDIFQNHGFSPEGEAGGQAYGNCVFCGAERKFYIKGETGQCDCKVCGFSGNHFSFMRRVWREALKRTSPRQLAELSRLRGLPVGALRAWGCAWSAELEAWLVPAIGPKGGVTDLRYWSPKRKLMRSTKGCQVQLMNANALEGLGAGARVWIAEGEWDGMALEWVLRRAGREDAVVAVPGAGVLKPAWTERLSAFRCNIMYDADEAGQKGAQKAKRLLPKSAVLVWPEGTEDGHDVRDLVVTRLAEEVEPGRIVEELEGLLQKDLPGGRRVVADEEVGGSGAGDCKVWNVGEAEDPPSLADVFKVFEQHVQMGDDMHFALEFALAHGFANQSEGDPLWSYLVGPPGSGKTLILMSMRGSERCCFNSSVTPHSLVSGFKANPDPSQLPLWDGRCAVLKDFTELMATHPQAKEELFATLRGAYDGHVRRPFGNGVVREYFLRFALLAGVTPAVHADKQASLGERFLKFEMLKGEWSADDEILAAIESTGAEVEIAAKLADVVGRFLSREVDEKAVVFPDKFKRRLVALAQVVSALRAQVDREQWGEQRLKYRPVREVGTRLAKQLVKLGRHLALVRGVNTVDEPIWERMERVAVDTASDFGWVVAGQLAERGELGRADLVELTELPATTLERTLVDLEALRMVKVRLEGGTGGRPRKTWRLAENLAGWWKEAGL